MTEIHYIALLDEAGEIVRTVPLDRPIDVPDRDDVTVKDIRLNVSLEYRRSS